MEDRRWSLVTHRLAHTMNTKTLVDTIMICTYSNSLHHLAQTSKGFVFWAIMFHWQVSCMVQYRKSSPCDCKICTVEPRNTMLWENGILIPFQGDVVVSESSSTDLHFQYVFNIKISKVRSGILCLKKISFNPKPSQHSSPLPAVDRPVRAC